MVILLWSLSRSRIVATSIGSCPTNGPWALVGGLALAEFASGALGTIEATTAAFPGYARRLELTGSNGTAILDGDALVAVDLRDGSAGAGLKEDVGPKEAPVNAASPVVSDVAAHRAVFEDFIRAMQTGGRPCCDGAEGRRSLEVIEAIYRTSATGAPVTLSR